MKIDAKKKKAVVGGACLAVVALGGALLMGGDKTPPQAPPQSAKAALAEAQRKLATQHAAPAAPPASVNPVRIEPSVASAKQPAEPAVATSPAAGQVGGDPVPTADRSRSQAVVAGQAPRAAAAAAVQIEQTAPVVTQPSDIAAAPAPLKKPIVPASAPPSPSVASPAPAAASAPSPANADYTAGWELLSDLEHQVSVLQLRAKVAELQRKIDGPDNGAQFPPPTASPVAVMPPPAMDAAVVSLPVPHSAVSTRSSLLFRSVVMVDGKYQGVIRSGGAELTVHEGSVLSDGWSVESIGPASVSLVRGRHRKTVQIGG